MSNTKRKVGVKIVKWILLAFLALIAFYFIYQAIACIINTKKAYKNLETYNVKTVNLSYGKMTYIDEGDGEVILSIHGIFGGYDQAYETVKNKKDTNRILAPSRFGYLGSSIKGEGSPKEQAKAYKELLDYLGIEKVFVLATSAGGTPAIRFALDYPEYVKGLILYCSAMPMDQKPETFIEYQAPPKPLLSNYAMHLISPLFPAVMGMPSSTVKTILPVSERKEGVILDGKLTNPDMERNFDDYDIENLQMPTLILHSEDDNVASFKKVEKAKHRFPNLTIKAFPTGGHMMVGNSEAIEFELNTFIVNNSWAYKKPS